MLDNSINHIVSYYYLFDSLHGDIDRWDLSFICPLINHKCLNSETKTVRLAFTQLVRMFAVQLTFELCHYHSNQG